MITFSRATQLVKMLGARHARIATAICLCLTGSAVPLNAQNSVVFGNAVITPGLQSQGFTITTSVNQTDTTSSVTYNITPPDNYVVNTETIVGQIGIQFLVPAGSQASGTATITYTGWANVLGAASGGFFASGGYNGGAGPQMVNFSTAAGAGTLSFYIAGTTIGGSQPAPASSITISLDIGNPRHGRKAYLNDYLGMGKTNYAIWRPSEGNWYLDLINQPSVVAQWGEPGDVPAPGDYDGDGITDLAVWRPSDQVWYIILSGSGQPIGVQWGLPGDIPIIGADYDGDGRTDLAIWRPSDGTWWVQFSSTGEVVVTQWGVPGDVPLVGDFNGDGKTDYVIWRPSEGNWYVKFSGSDQATVYQWGLPQDIPMPQDFDGDGITDYAIWRPSDGNWWVKLSSTGDVIVAPWGLPGDIPVSGDFDGDGKADYAIWRPTEGNWYITFSGNGTSTVHQWGMDGDIPNGEPVMSILNPQQ